MSAVSWFQSLCIQPNLSSFFFIYNILHRPFKDREVDRMLEESGISNADQDVEIGAASGY